MAVPYFPAGYGSTYGYPPVYSTGLGIPGSVGNGMINPSNNQNGLITAWVQGIAAMKSFSMGPNQKAFLFNTEENNFGIKSTDANGMPYPLEIFRYERETADTPRQAPQEQQAPPLDPSTFVTRKEFESRIASMMQDFESNSTMNKPNNQNRGDQKHGK